MISRAASGATLPGAFGIKDKPQGIRPQLRRQQSVFQISDAADFDSNHNYFLLSER